MSNKFLMSLVVTIAMAGFSVNAAALCKVYPTRGENRSGAIGGYLDEIGVPEIGASDEAPCVPDPPDTPDEPKSERMEFNTDRMGSDYKHFDLGQANPALCQTLCNQEAQCKAWTYGKPGFKGPRALCWLKTSVPAANHNACCVSGVK